MERTFVGSPQETMGSTSAVNVTRKKNLRSPPPPEELANNQDT
jgi:hypothetical protein